jgi:biopolymer transport protein ExbD
MPKVIASAPNAGGRHQRGRRLGGTLAEIGIKVLAERLRQQMVNRTDKQVFLRGDAELQVQNLIDVLDQLKAAGVENVGIVTELPER